MNNLTNDDLITEIQLNENTYERNRVTKTLGGKPKEIYTKTTDKMIKEYKDEMEKNIQAGLRSDSFTRIVGEKPKINEIEVRGPRAIKNAEDRLNELISDRDDALFRYEEIKNELIKLDDKWERDDNPEIELESKNESTKWMDDKKRYYKQRGYNNKEIEELLRKDYAEKYINESKYNESNYNIERDLIIKRINKYENDIERLNDEISGQKEYIEGLKLYIVRVDKENKENLNQYRQTINNTNNVFIREQTPGERDEDYQQYIIETTKPLDDDKIKKIAELDQIKILKANFASIFNITNSKRLSLIEDIITKIDEMEDEQIYNTNTKWPLIKKKLIDTYGFDNPNVDISDVITTIRDILNIPLNKYDKFKDNDKSISRQALELAKEVKEKKGKNKLQSVKGATEIKEDTGRETKHKNTFSSLRMKEEEEESKEEESKEEESKEEKINVDNNNYPSVKLTSKDDEIYVIIIQQRPEGKKQIGEKKQNRTYIGISPTGLKGSYKVKPGFSIYKRQQFISTFYQGTQDPDDEKKAIEQWDLEDFDYDDVLFNKFRVTFFDNEGYLKRIIDTPLKHPIISSDFETIRMGDLPIMAWKKEYTFKNGNTEAGIAKSQTRKQWIKNYIKIKEPIIGAGISIPKHDKIIKFGNVLLLYDRLIKHNMLSVKKKGGGNIENFKNVRVSDKFVDIITGAINKQNINDIYNELNEDEQHLYNILVQISGIHKYVKIPAPNIKFLKDKLKLIEGEIEAGNDNVIEQLADILNKMVIVKLITKKQAIEHYNKYK